MHLLKVNSLILGKEQQFGIWTYSTNCFPR